MKNSIKAPLESLTTEARNPLTRELDNLSALEIVKLINSEDQKVALAVGRESESIARAIDVIADRLCVGGRLIYVGAGTSGRLGVLDAVECPPTFNTDPELVLGLIAGGPEGLIRAIEGAEDCREMGRVDLQGIKLDKRDVVVGIAASGRTPYVIGALDYARQTNAFTIGFSCNKDAELIHHTDLNIIPVVGPEVLSGSTRLKAGTATKMVLNMLTTGAMVRLGKTYSNLMVDLRATNLKLGERARRIVEALTDCKHSEAKDLLNRCDGEVKTAIVANNLGISPDAARARLQSVKGHLRQALAKGLGRVEMSSCSQPPCIPGSTRFLLAVDGGGSKTAALVASLDEAGERRILGRGRGGPSNLRLAGKQQALANLDQAVDEALGEAGLEGLSVDSAVLALAGATYIDVRDEVYRWARQRKLSHEVEVIHDAEPILASCLGGGPGIALIVGTGSVAVGLNDAGQKLTLGGWGHWFGDKGSGYDLGRQALSAIAEASDGIGPKTVISDLVLERLGIDEPRQILRVMSARENLRREVAALAPAVQEAAAMQDKVANKIVQNAINEAARLVTAVVKRLEFEKPYQLILAGGVICGSQHFRDKLIVLLGQSQPPPGKVTVVDEPVMGCLEMACARLTATTG